MFVRGCNNQPPGFLRRMTPFFSQAPRSTHGPGEDQGSTSPTNSSILASFNMANGAAFPASSAKWRESQLYTVHRIDEHANRRPYGDESEDLPLRKSLRGKSRKFPGAFYLHNLPGKWCRAMREFRHKNL